jgi:hypothetical protein
MNARRDPHVEADPTNRSRGRPRLPQALTPAQRAQRYRDKKKREQMVASGGATASASATGGAAIKHKVTNNVGPTIGLLESRLILANAENIRLSDDLEVARDQLQALSRALAESLRAHAAKKALPAERVRAIAELLLPQEAKRFGVKSVTRHKK